MLLDLMVHSDITFLIFLLAIGNIPDCLFSRCRAEESPTTSFADLHQEVTLAHIAHQEPWRRTRSIEDT